MKRKQKMKLQNFKILTLAVVFFSSISLDVYADEEALSKIYQPKLKGIWTIEVLPNIDYHLADNDGEYAVFVLKAHIDSFEKPSEVYPDFDKILHWYKTQLNSSLNGN